MRGFEQCSTSYTVGSKCAWQQARPQCPLRHTTIRPVRQRLHAVSAKDTSLAHSTPDGQMAIQQAPWGGQVIQSFLRPHVTFQEAVDGSWADKVDDWAAFWEGPYEIVDNDAELVDYELDDTYDALKRRTQHANTWSLVQALSFLSRTAHIKFCFHIQATSETQSSPDRQRLPSQRTCDPVHGASSIQTRCIGWVTPDGRRVSPRTQSLNLFLSETGLIWSCGPGLRNENGRQAKMPSGFSANRM